MGTMPKKSNGRGDTMRRRLAHEAARLIAEHGIENYRLAKRKAAHKLGVSERNFLPANAEVHSALAEYQRLFDGAAHSDRLLEFRRTAREAMLMFEDFQPRLVGPVLAGTATRHSEVNLHLFADAPEDVAMRLLDDRIAYRSAEKRIRYVDDRVIRYPAFRFKAFCNGIEIVVFPTDGLREAPACPVNGRPMQRANLKEVERLLDAMHADN